MRLTLWSILAGFYLGIGFPLNGFCQNTTAPSMDSLTDSSPKDERFGSSSIQRLDEVNFNKGIIHNPVQLFNGLLTGLGMARYGNDPNGEFVIRMRGLSTFQNNTTPLFVVNGFITDNLLLVDPNDIDEVVILKDASATSVYGPRGANGIILLNTKKAKGFPLISYSTSVSIENPIKKIEPSSTSEYKSLPTMVDYGDANNWMDKILRTAVSTVNSVSITGGSKIFSFRASTNYRTAQGTLEGTGFRQLNTRISVQQRALHEKLNIGMEAGLTARESDFGFREAIKYAWNSNPTMPLYDQNSPQNGFYFQPYTYEVYNPVAIIDQNINSGKERTAFAGISGNYRFDRFLRGLGVNVSYWFSNQDDLFGRYYSKESYYVGVNRNGLAIRNSRTISNQQFDMSLNFKRTIKLMDVELTSGYQYQRSSEDGLYLEGGDFITDEYGFSNMDASRDFEKGLGTIESHAEGFDVISFHGGGFLKFKNRYFLNANANYSGSTRFGAENKWGLFPSIGGGVQWENDVLFFDFLKIRAAWGKSGNLPQASNLSNSSMGPSGSFYYNGSYIDTYSIVRGANPGLKWEEKSEINIGADFTILHGRVRGSLDWFKNKVNDLITEVSIPSPPNLGIYKVVNLGEIQNTGVEIGLQVSAANTDKFSWNFGVNVSTVSTKINSLEGNGYSIGNNGQLLVGTTSQDGGGCGCSSFIRIKEGEKAGEIFGPVFNGINSDGSPQLADISGDGYCNCYEDFTVIGKALPSVVFGFNHSIAYKNFVLSFLLRGALGHSKINGYRLSYEGQDVARYYNVVKTRYYDPNLNYNIYSSLYVENAGFVKLDNINLAYHIPFRTRISINFTIQNLFTLTRYTGLDPEVAYSEPVLKGSTRNIINNSPLISGLDKVSNYFPSRIFSIGANFLF